MEETSELRSTMEVPSDLYGESTGGQDWFYNEDSGLIILEGGERGHLLARYMGSEYPDPRRFKFLVTYQKNYPTYEKHKAPAFAPADVCAIAWPVERNRDPRSGVTSGATGDAVSGKGESGPTTVITPESGHDTPLPDLSGMQLTPNRVDVFADGGGLAVDSDGLHVEGGMEQPNTQKKGVMQESSLFGLVPKTLVTFFASDYLPNIKLVTRLAEYVSIIRRMPSLIESIARIANDLGAETDPDDVVGSPAGVSDPFGGGGYEGAGINRLLPDD